MTNDNIPIIVRMIVVLLLVKLFFGWLLQIFDIYYGDHSQLNELNELNELNKLNELTKTQKRTRKILEWLTYIPGIILSLLLSVALVFAGFYILQGDEPLADFLNYLADYARSRH